MNNSVWITVCLVVAGIVGGAASAQKTAREVRQREEAQTPAPELRVPCAEVTYWLDVERDGWQDVWVSTSTYEPLACACVDILGASGEFVIDPDEVWTAGFHELENGKPLRTTAGLERVCVCSLSGVEGWARVASVQSPGEITLQANGQFSDTIIPDDPDDEVQVTARYTGAEPCE
jgi:hypothetical protein